MRKFIYPYKAGSRSCKSIRRSLNRCRMVKKVNSKYKGAPNKMVINWGCSQLPQEVLKCSVINHPNAVARCSNKLRFFNHISNSNVNHPEFTTDVNDVLLDIAEEDSSKVRWFGRSLLEAHSGRGIQIIKGSQSEVPQCPLYVKRVKKSQEYRIHVFQGDVIAKQRKARRNSVPDDQVNWQVRSHGNGFIFAINEDHEYPQHALDNAVRCVEYCGLDFGAVDVVWDGETSWVLEVNTAPGLEGSTLQAYTEVFNGLR